MNELHFKKRVCPLCGNAVHTPVLKLEPHEIISANWSYQREKKDSLPDTIPASFDIVRCDSCAFIYAEYLPPHEFLSFVYDELIDIEAARQESYSRHNLAGRMEYLAKLLRLVPDNARILDFGCGFGPTLALLNAVQRIEAVGLEVSKARARELERWHRQIVRDAAGLKAHGPFDAVVLDNVLEHVPDPRQTINLISSVCSEGAIFYVSVPDIGQKYLRAQIGLNKHSKLLGMDINPWEHLNYFDLAHLDSLMESAGFVALDADELPGEVSIGLRAESGMVERVKNAMASMYRCAKYALTGKALSSVNRRFYRFKGKAVG